MNPFLAKGRMTRRTRDSEAILGDADRRQVGHSGDGPGIDLAEIREGEGATEWPAGSSK